MKNRGFFSSYNWKGFSQGHKMVECSKAEQSWVTAGFSGVDLIDLLMPMISLSPYFENDRFVSLEAQFLWNWREGAWLCALWWRTMVREPVRYFNLYFFGDTKKFSFFFFLNQSPLIRMLKLIPAFRTIILPPRELWMAIEPLIGSGSHIPPCEF